jgi:hypothetical protein
LYAAANTAVEAKATFDCQSVLDPDTFIAAGGADALCRVNASGLHVVMAPTATLLPGQPFALLEGQTGLVAALTNVPFVLGIEGPLVVAGCGNECIPPNVVLSGPHHVVEHCPGEWDPAAPAAVFNVAASADPSGRRYGDVQWYPAYPSFYNVSHAKASGFTVLETLLKEHSMVPDIR